VKNRARIRTLSATIEIDRLAMAVNRWSPVWKQSTGAYSRRYGQLGGTHAFWKVKAASLIVLVSNVM
jgi:hypothetical protein